MSSSASTIACLLLLSGTVRTAAHAIPADLDFSNDPNTSSSCFYVPLHELKRRSQVINSPAALSLILRSVSSQRLIDYSVRSHHVVVLSNYYYYYCCTVALDRYCQREGRVATAASVVDVSIDVVRETLDMGDLQRWRLNLMI